MLDAPDILAMTLFGVKMSFQGIQDAIVNNPYGFWGGVGLVFTLLFACGLGLPLPEDVPLILAGALLLKAGEATVTDWVIVGAACWSGIIAGDICLYLIGRRLGPNVTKLPLIGKHVTHERLERVAGLFEKYGILVVGFGRLVAGIRGAMVVTAGTIRFSFIKFIVADGIAAVISGGLFVVIGHWLGKQLTPQNFERFKHFFFLGVIALVVVVIAYIYVRRRLHKPVSVVVEKKIEEKAQTAGNVTLPPPNP